MAVIDRGDRSRRWFGRQLSGGIHLASGLLAYRRIAGCWCGGADCIAKPRRRLASSAYQSLRRDCPGRWCRGDHRTSNRGPRGPLKEPGQSLRSTLTTSCDDSDDHPDDHEGNPHNRENGEDLAEHAANADVLFVGVVDTRCLNVPLGLVTQVPGDRGEDRDEDAEDSEDQDQGALRVLLYRRRSVWLTVRRRLTGRLVLLRGRVGTLPGLRIRTLAGLRIGRLAGLRVRGLAGLLVRSLPRRRVGSLRAWLGLRLLLFVRVGHAAYCSLHRSPGPANRPGPPDRHKLLIPTAAKKKPKMSHMTITIARKTSAMIVTILPRIRPALIFDSLEYRTPDARISFIAFAPRYHAMAAKTLKKTPMI